MEFGWPANLTWYKLLLDRQTLIAGLIAILAAIIAYLGSLKQVAETRRAAMERKWAHTVMTGLEAQRLEVEAKRQLRDVNSAVREKDKDHVEVRYTLSRIETY